MGTLWLAASATVLAALALLLDLLQITAWGGRLAWPAIALAGICALALGRRGRVFWIFALALLGLARWLRGSAGVSPDPPLLVLQLIAVLLMAWRVLTEKATLKRRHLRTDT